MNIDSFRGHIPDAVLTQIPSVMETFQINTPLRLCHFLAQCAHESGNFRFTSENLNYSARGLLITFSRYFPTETLARQYERNPQRIANLVYANRMGNGPETSDDGWRFRGRGYIQLTGRSNYQAFDRVVTDNIMENPDLVATKYPLLSTAWFWNSRTLNSLADRGATELEVTAVTRRVNGGTIGLADRIKHFKQLYDLIN